MITDPYEDCPTVENSDYMIRFVEVSDAESLLPCYAHPTESVITNSFNCTMGYNAHTIEQMRECIKGWQRFFKEKSFIRWSIVNKSNNNAVGTIELFNRYSIDFYDNCVILRLDLCDKYEKFDEINKILELIIPNAFHWFGCKSIATKVNTSAIERIESLNMFGFKKSQHVLKCDNDVEYDGFWVLDKH